jgi:rhodanese-related sulfurtransferase
VAHLLQKEGFKVFVITGGLRAWRKAGQAVEPVPSDDVIKLPMFT